MYLKKSLADAPVAASIFEMLHVDGQRGCPKTVIRLLLLKVVGSSPLLFASPEQVIPWSCANSSIACQIC